MSSECHGKYKWVDVTDDLEQTEFTQAYSEVPGIQYLHGTRIVFTLIDTPIRVKKLIPGRPMQEGDYRVTVDYDADPKNGIGAVFQKRYIEE